MSREVKYTDPNNLLIVGLDVSGDANPLLDERWEWGVDPNLVKNILVYGVQQPVLVREEAGQLFVIDGRQRVKSAREAARHQDGAGEYGTKVPYIVVTADDDRVTGIMISTNELRQDDDVLGKAKKAARLLDMLGSIDEVATAFGKSTKTIQNWLMLVQADPRVHAAINEGKISASAGIDLARLTREEQNTKLDELLAAAAGPVSESQAKKARSTTSHQGIKKGWVRQALKTKAAEKLCDEERDTLKWILTGTAPKGSWMDTFFFDAETELLKLAEAKAAKKDEP